jgi:hypothetical protein
MCIQYMTTIHYIVFCVIQGYEQRCVSNTWLYYSLHLVSCVTGMWTEMCIQYMTVLFITFGFVCYGGMNRDVYTVRDCTIHCIVFRVLQGYEQRWSCIGYSSSEPGKSLHKEMGIATQTIAVITRIEIIKFWADCDSSLLLCVLCSTIMQTLSNVSFFFSFMLSKQL